MGDYLWRFWIEDWTLESAYEYSVFSTHSSMLNVAMLVPSVSLSRKMSAECRS